MGTPRTKAEKLERVEFARLCLAKRIRRGDIKRVMREKWRLSRQCVERDLATARKLLIEETDAPREHHFSDAFAFYSEFVGDQQLSPELRIKAQERLDKLLALEKPATTKTIHQFDWDKLYENGENGKPGPIEQRIADESNGD